MDMGQKIKAIREAKGMTLEELGNKVGVGKSTVRKWENGIIANMKRDKIAKVAAALDCSPSYLMGWESDAELNATLQDNSAHIAMIPAVNFLKGIGCQLKYTVTKKQDGSQIIHDIQIIDGEKIYFVTYENLESFISSVTPFVRFNYSELIQQGCPDGYKYIFKAPKYNNSMSIKKDNPTSSVLTLNAAHAIDGASEEDKQHDEDIMNDPDF